MFAVLLVFAQVAVAADRCVPERLLRSLAAPGGAVAHTHYGVDASCVGHLMPLALAPASEPEFASADYPPADATALLGWHTLSRFVPPTVTRRDWRVDLPSGPPPRLQFRNLRL